MCFSSPVQPETGTPCILLIPPVQSILERGSRPSQATIPPRKRLYGIGTPEREKTCQKKLTPKVIDQNRFFLKDSASATFLGGAIELTSIAVVRTQLQTRSYTILKFTQVLYRCFSQKICKKDCFLSIFPLFFHDFSQKNGKTRKNHSQMNTMNQTTERTNS